MTDPVPIQSPSPSKVSLYFDGDAYFASLREAIAVARESIDLEFYTFASDSLGWSFAHLLRSKAEEGVRVRLIYDSIGSSSSSIDLFDELEGENISYKAYNPLLPLWRNFGRRNHRKIAVIDRKIGFLGGFNLASEYSNFHSSGKGWRDTGVRIEKLELVLSLQKLFEESWQEREISLRKFLKKRRKRANSQRGNLYLTPNYGWKSKSLIRHEYLSAIVRAKESVEITNPYFIPDPVTLRALRKAAQRGVKVSILTAGPCDVRIAHWAGQATYSRLLRAGVRIFEFQPCILHAKTASVDGEWFTVGTANIDHLSFFKNLEVNLIGRDAALAGLVSAQFQEDLAQSKEILRQSWKKRGTFARLRERFFFWFREWL